MKENQVRENIAAEFITVADVFTKERKDITHFVELRDMFMCPRLNLSVAV
jgi:hypothetical protein